MQSIEDRRPFRYKINLVYMVSSVNPLGAGHLVTSTGLFARQKWKSNWSGILEDATREAYR